MATSEDYCVVLLATVESLRAKAASISGNDAYDQGRQMAYFEFLQLIIDNAETVGMTAREVGMDGFTPGSVIGLQSR